MNSLVEKCQINIVIPTYNRIFYLKKTLKSIFSDKLDMYISVSVIDNCSSDGTWEWLNEFSSNKKIKIYRNTLNLGLEGNIIESLKLNLNGYTWMMSDHMLLLPNSISMVKSFLHSNRDVLFCCSPIRTFSTCVSEAPEKKLLGDLKNLDDLLFSTSNISGMIVRNDIIAKSLRNIYRFSGFGYPHLGVYTNLFLDSPIATFPVLAEFLPSSSEARNVSYNIFKSRYIGYPNARKQLAALNHDLQVIKLSKSNKMITSSFMLDAIVGLIADPVESLSFSDFISCRKNFSGKIRWLSLVFSFVALFPFSLRVRIIKMLLAVTGKSSIVELEINSRLYSSSMNE